MRMKLEHKKILLSVVPIILIAVLLVPTNLALAQWWNPIDQLFDLLAEIIYSACVAFGGIFLTVGGSLLDLTVYWFIVEMGDWFAAPGANLSGSVAAGWTLIRDLLNMGFIFGLVFIGIKTILNSEDSGTRRALGYLIAAALLINFSLLITQVIIDFSNLIGAQIYAQLDAAGGGDDSLTMPITSSFLNSLGLTSILGGNAGALTAGPGGFLKTVIVGFAIMGFFMIAGLIFALGAIMVITRFIALTLYMIFSPLMFIGWILPQFQSLASKWWGGFFKYVWFGPIFLFLIYLSAAMTQDISATLGIGGFADFADTAEFDGGLVETVLLFIIAMGLLYGSLKVGDKMSISGSKLVMNGMGAAQGLAYRTTVAKGINKFGVKTYDKLDQAAEGEGWTRYGARTARALAGGETGRRAVVKARDYGAGGTGWTESEKMDTERTARATRAKRLDTITAKRDYGKLSKPQLIKLLKSKKDRDKLFENGGVHALTASQIKDIRGSDELDDGIINEVNSRLGEGVSSVGATIDLKGGKRKELANLPDEVLLSDDFMPKMAEKELLDADFLQQVSRESNVDKKKIGEKVLKQYGAQNDINKLPPDIRAFMLSGAGASFLPKNAPANATNKGSGNSSNNNSSGNQGGNKPQQRTKDGVEYTNVAAADGNTDKKTEGGVILP